MPVSKKTPINTHKVDLGKRPPWVTVEMPASFYEEVVECAKCHNKIKVKRCVPLFLIWDHCYERTSYLKDLNRLDSVCEDCCDDIFLDGMWHSGWEIQSNFIFKTLTEASRQETNSHTKNRIIHIFSKGVWALGQMCIGCSGDVWNIPRPRMPEYLKKAQTEKFDCYNTPQNIRKNFDSLFCLMCIQEIESSFISDMPYFDLPLHVSTEWITQEAKVQFETRLKG